MSQFIVIEIIHALPGQGAALKQALLDLMPLCRKEQGCINYDIAVSDTAEDIFLVLMEWETPADLEAHVQSEHILEFVKKYENVLYGKVTESHWESC